MVKTYFFIFFWMYIAKNETDWAEIYWPTSENKFEFYAYPWYLELEFFKLIGSQHCFVNMEIQI
jgi:hypothetical protein